MDKATIKKKAYAFAKTLKERNQHAIKQIERLIEHMGLEFVQEQVTETLRIEAEGGMMTADGKRRRTAGGVLFYIIKPKLSPDIHKLIFTPPDWKKLKARKNAQQEGQDVAQESKQLAAKVAKTTKNIAKLNEKVSALDSPNTDQSKLQQLRTAAETLRKRLAKMEAEGQQGISMTKTLLKNTEKQIEALEAD